MASFFSISLQVDPNHMNTYKKIKFSGVLSLKNKFNSCKSTAWSSLTDQMFDVILTIIIGYILLCRMNNW